MLEDLPEFVTDAQRLTVAEATELARDLDRRGLVHSIWTLDTPFIVGVCSCRPGECLGLDYTLAGARVLFNSTHGASPRFLRGAHDGRRPLDCRGCVAVAVPAFAHLDGACPNR